VRSIKPLSAAIVLSFALLAALAVTPASAEVTVFCKANEEKCAEKNILGPELTGYLGSSDLTTFMEVVLPKKTVKCTEGKLGPIALKETAGPLVGSMQFWWSFKCSPSGCVVEVLEEGYAAEVEATGKGNGTLAVTVPTLRVECWPTEICTYSKTPIQFTVAGGSPAYVSSKASLSLVSGFGSCAPATLNSKYLVVSPGTSVFVTHR
jgi:hypothetical protein